MKTFGGRIWSIAAALTLAACSSNQQHTVLLLPADEFIRYLEENDPQVLDVRSQKEFLVAHVDNAINIDIKTQRFDNAVEETLTRDRPVAVYCWKGERSRVAANIMNDMGYTVVELKDGLVTWPENE